MACFWWLNGLRSMHLLRDSVISIWFITGYCITLHYICYLPVYWLNTDCNVRENTICRVQLAFRISVTWVLYFLLHLYFNTWGQLPRWTWVNWFALSFLPLHHLEESLWESVAPVLQAMCHWCHPTNSVKVWKEICVAFSLVLCSLVLTWRFVGYRALRLRRYWRSRNGWLTLTPKSH